MSIYKVNKNTLKRIEFSGSTGYSDNNFITASVYDNDFVSRPIPRSDYQYLWITSSITEDDRAQFGLGYITGSNDYAFFTASEVEIEAAGNPPTAFYYAHYPRQYPRLNVYSGNERDRIKENGGVITDNTLYEPIRDILITEADFLDPNSFRYHKPYLDGIYDYYTNFYFRGSSQRFRRNWSHNNIFPVAEVPKVKEKDNRTFKDKRAQNNNIFRYSPIDSSNRPLQKNFEYILNSDIGLVAPLNINLSYTSNKSYIDKKIDGKILDESQKNPKVDRVYKKLLDYSLKNQSGYNPLDRFVSFKFSQNIWPQRQYKYLTETREREVYKDGYWRTKREDRTVDNLQYILRYSLIKGGSSIVSTTENLAGSSIFPLDTPADYETYTFYGVNDTSIGDANMGRLQVPGTFFHNGDETLLTASAQYARRFAESSSIGVFYAGPTKFEADVYGNSKPSHNTYEEFVGEERFLLKDYSIIPEFKMSDHIKDYLDDGSFVATKNLFSLTGSSFENDDDKFFRTYCTSELLREFGNIKEDYSSLGEEGQISLKIKAYKKFFPYDGFFPADRSVDLFDLFLESYRFGPNNSNSRQMPRAVYPFFSPGILYNSIKAGISVDYPYYIDSAITIQDSAIGDLYDSGDITATRTLPGGGTARFVNNYGDSFFGNKGRRLPFEGLLNPTQYFSNITKHECHPSATFAQPSSSLEERKAYYRNGINNYLSEMSDFFLEDKITSIESLYDDDPSFGVVDLSKDYILRFKLTTERNKKLSDFVETGIGPILKSGSYGETFLPFDRPFFDSASLPNWNSLDEYQFYFHGGTAFGPNHGMGGSLGTKYSASYGLVNHFPHTPPYMPTGYAEFAARLKPSKIVGTDTGSVKLSVDAILENITYDVNVRDGSDGTDNEVRGGRHFTDSDAMKIGDCFDLFSTKIKTNSTSSAIVFNPKMEFPLFNYLDYADGTKNITLPENGSGSVSVGNWLQWGDDLEDGQGLVYELTEWPSDRKNDTALTGSLIDVLGIDPNTSRTVGKLNSSKTISEALVLIPFIDEGDRKFFEFDREELENSNDKNIKKLKRLFSKYVMPPSMDYYKNENIQPFAIFFTEFTYNFNRADIKKIWHNMLPDTGLNSSIEEREINIDVNNGFPVDNFNIENAKWLVFKVKQKGLTDFKSFKNKYLYNRDVEPVHDLSFNWPYDFCSIVEMANLDLDVVFRSDDEEEPKVRVKEDLISNPNFKPKLVKTGNNFNIDKEDS